jgi:alcohol dehydrogenase
MYTFQTVPDIVVGPGCLAQLPGLLHARWAPERVLLVTDAGFRATGLLAAPLAALAEAGVEVTVFDGVVADPPEAVVRAAIGVAQAARAQGVLAIGGGSSMDVAKLVAVFAGSAQDLAAAYGVDKVAGARRLPLVQVPTTAGTGSEVTCVAIVTTGATTKMGVVSRPLYADLALLDAQLTVGLPRPITAATGIDAMVHAIEAYTSRARKNPLSDAAAREALRLLSGALLPACTDGANLAARSDMLLGAMLAGQAFANAPVAAVHALAYPLGGIFHVPHGLSNALMLPHVLRFNLPAAAGLYAELAAIVAPAAGGDAPQRAQAFIGALEHLIEGSGLVRRLRDVGVAERDLPTLAEQAMLQQRLLVNNPRDVGLADALALYSAAW